MSKATKIANTALRYMGASKQAARKPAKKLAKILQAQVKGKSRGEKQAFYRAYGALAQGKNTDMQLYRMMTGDIMKVPVEQYRAGCKSYEEIVRPLQTRRIVKEATVSINKVVDKIPEQLTVSLRPCLEKAANQAVQQTMKDLPKIIWEHIKTMTGRRIAIPYNIIRFFRNIPKGMRNFYAQMTAGSRYTFANDFYQQFVKLEGLAERAPAKAVVTDKCASIGIEVQGGFNPLNNTIEFTREMRNLPRGTQANLISHELEHFRQADSMIRTVGIDGYIEALKKQAVFNMIEDSSHKLPLEQAQQQVEELFAKENVAEQVRTAFAKSAQAPKIDPNSAEGKEALQLLDALSHYRAVRSKCWGLITDIPETYRENYMEVLAYAKGKKIGTQMSIMESLNLNNI